MIGCDVALLDRVALHVVEFGGFVLVHSLHLVAIDNDVEVSIAHGFVAVMPLHEDLPLWPIGIVGIGQQSPRCYFPRVAVR